MFQMRANIVAMGVIGAALLLPDLAHAEQVGNASWYALRSRTASGEIMNPSEMTAAHRSLPFGTKVLVENLSNGRSVVVRINDRGPFAKGRIIDLSRTAASSLGMLGSGTARVRVSVAGKNSVRNESRKVAGLMRSASDVKRVASRASSRNLAVASRAAAHRAVTVASREFGKARRGQAPGIILASSTNSYGAFARTASFVN
jgi:peptidoglycan lytic transglycosylase